MLIKNGADVINLGYRTVFYNEDISRMPRFRLETANR